MEIYEAASDRLNRATGRHVVEQAMQAAGVHRLVITSSHSVMATRPWLAVRLAWLVFGNAYRDLARAEELVRMSGLQWSIVRATMLTDGPPAGRAHTDDPSSVTFGKLR